MIQQVAGLINQMIAGAVGGLDHSLQRLFAHLLGYLVDAILEELRGIRSLRHLLITLVDKVLQLAQERYAAVVLLAPTSIGTCVTSRTIGMGLHQEGIVVAIHLDVN